AKPDDELHVELRVLGERRDVEVRIEDLDVRSRLDVAGGHLALAARLDARRLLDGAVVQLDAHPLQADADYRRALKRRQQHAPERVPDRDAVAALERLAEELPVRRREALLVDLQPLRLHQLTPVALYDGVGALRLEVL